MKKKYIAPNMEIVKVEAQQILAGSVPMYGKDAEGAAMAPEYEWSEWSF